jgi:calcineurin-like phosphoesterase family protein
MTTWFTSDEHYGHRNICELSGRPFASLDDMESQMVERFNARVGPYDVTVHVGDFSFYPLERTRTILSSLNGRHRLVLGNHDRSAAWALNAGFVPPSDLRGADARQFTAKFDPPVPAGATVRLCGHVHEHWQVRQGWVNVGVDQWNFAPVSLDEILAAVV